METSLKDESLFWQKKEVISFILSILVFFIHISSLAQYSDSGSFVSVINQKFGYLFKVSITSFAVPMFFVLSGIAFFKNYNNKKYFSKIKSRIFTLIIPYLLWNTIWMIFEIICSYSFISNFFVGRGTFELSFINIIMGIFFYKCNGPFWFVFNLIIFCIAAPLIYIIIRNKYVGIVSVILLTILSVFGIQIPPSLFFSSTSIIFFMIGAIIGKHYFGFVCKKSSKIVQVFSIVFLALNIIFNNIFELEKSINNSVFEVVVFTLSAFVLWNITDIFFDKIKPKRIFSRSFAIYAMHINVSAIITKVLFICLPKNEWLAIPNFVITAVLTILLINVVCELLEKFFPKIYSILMGNRLKH